jgi:hypothetical protein
MGLIVQINCVDGKRDELVNGSWIEITTDADRLTETERTCKQPLWPILVDRRNRYRVVEFKE